MILVTGATGRTGQHVVDSLLAAGQHVRVLARATSTLPARWSGVERALGDLDDAASVRRAADGVDGLFVLTPMDPDLDRWDANAYAAAEAAGVAHVVKMSTTTPHPQSPIPWWRAHWRSEQALRASGLRWTILRPNGITFFLLGHAREVREHGELRTAAGDGRMALVDAADIASVTTAVLADPVRWSGETLDVTGPAAVSYSDVAAMLSVLLAHDVRHVDLPRDVALQQLHEDGRAEWEVEGVLANWQMTRDGSGGFDRVSHDVERATGRPPLDVDQFLRAHLGEFGAVS